MDKELDDFSSIIIEGRISDFIKSESYNIKSCDFILTSVGQKQLNPLVSRLKCYAINNAVDFIQHNLTRNNKVRICGSFLGSAVDNTSDVKIYVKNISFLRS